MNSTLGIEKPFKNTVNTLRVKPNKIFNRPKEQQSDRASMPEIGSPDKEATNQKYHHIISNHSPSEVIEDTKKLKQPGIRITMSCPKPSEKQLPHIDYQSGSTLRGVGSSIFTDIQKERKNQNKSEVKQYQKLSNSPLHHKESSINISPLKQIQLSKQYAAIKNQPQTQRLNQIAALYKPNP